MNYCHIARAGIAHWLNQRQTLNTDQRVGHKAACFVSLHTSDGQLRGCIGTLSPVREDLAQEIEDNAVSAATRDTRFSPLRPDELDNIVIEVSVLAKPEPIDGPHQLDVRRYGVIVERHGRRGVLLPDLEGVDTVDYQVSIAKRKAVIGEHEPVQMWRFEVEKYHESNHSIS